MPASTSPTTSRRGGELIFFDAVLDVNCNVLFNGTPDATAAWLIASADNWEMQQNARVCVGRTLETMSIDEYLRAHDRSSQK